MRSQHPPDFGLAEVLAQHGLTLIPILKQKLENPDDLAVVHLMLVIEIMQREGYAVRSDSSLMFLLSSKVNNMKSKIWREVATRSLLEIKGKK